MQATLDAVFFALSDRTRRGLLERLRGTEETAGALASGFAVTRPAVSRHLRILREAALVVERRRGRERVYTLAADRLGVATAWLDGYRVFWAARLHDLKDLVESLPDDDDTPDAAPPASREQAAPIARTSGRARASNDSAADAVRRSPRALSAKSLSRRSARRMDATGAAAQLRSREHAVKRGSRSTKTMRTARRNRRGDHDD